MSALLVDDLVTDEMAFVGWRQPNRPVSLVRSRSSDVLRRSEAKPQIRSTQSVRGVRSGWGSATGWRLTDRGIAVILALFVVLMLVSAIVVVANFLAIPNDPVDMVIFDQLVAAVER